MWLGAKSPSHREAPNSGCECETLTGLGCHRPRYPCGGGAEGRSWGGTSSLCSRRRLVSAARRLRAWAGRQFRAAQAGMTRPDRTGRDAKRAAPPHLSATFQGAEPGTEEGASQSRDGTAPCRQLRAAAGLGEAPKNLPGSHHTHQTLPAG